VILADRKVSAVYITKVAGQTYPGKISGPYRFLPKKDPRKKFLHENFWNFQITIQKFLSRPTFNRNFFGIFNFQTGKNSRNIRSREIELWQVYDVNVS